MTENARTLLQLFPQALAAGLLIASVCAILGVFVILKRVVFIGIALSEVAACGIAAGMVFHVPPFISASILTLATVAILSCPFEMQRLPRDAILGVVFVFAAAMSILIVSKSGFALHDVKSLLYGDLILTSGRDLKIVLAVLAPVLVYLLVFLRPTLYTFLDREAAKVLGIRVAAWELVYFFALGLTVSAASKVAGSLLVFCYLVVAPSTALLLSRRLWAVIVLSVLSGITSTLVGLLWSFERDLPTNQAIAAVSCALLFTATLVAATRRFVNYLHPR